MLFDTSIDKEINRKWRIQKPHIYVYLIYNKSATAIQWRKDGLARKFHPVP